MTPDEITKLVDEAFLVIAAGVRGARVNGKLIANHEQVMAAVEFTRNITVMAWLNREDARREEEAATDFPDVVNDGKDK